MPRTEDDIYQMLQREQNKDQRNLDAVTTDVLLRKVSGLGFTESLEMSSIREGFSLDRPVELTTIRETVNAYMDQGEAMVDRSSFDSLVAYNVLFVVLYFSQHTPDVADFFRGAVEDALDLAPLVSPDIEHFLRQIEAGLLNSET